MRATRVSEDIIGISELRANAASLVERAAETHAPIIVTQHGRAALVVLSPAAYDELTEHHRFIAAVQEGLAEAEAGLLIDHADVVKQMQARFGSGVAPRSKKGRKR